ncbi:hypothetical protein Bbelb_089250 [Branchiostoma belcheri]|nr:hypothetical protein Bbelb_089250 [Branchiostoma belcheri]
MDDHTLPQGCVISDPPDDTAASQLHIVCHIGIADRQEGNTVIPQGLPPNTTTLDFSLNHVKNLREFPVLKNLIVLNLGWNRMETLDWLVLRNLPALQDLLLNRNRLVKVNLGAVIKDLPNLKYVNLANNMLASFSSHQIGLPMLSLVKLQYNPLRCDCIMQWLVNRLRCQQETVQTEKHSRVLATCVQCDTCVFGAIQADDMVCASPSHLEGLPLSNASHYLTECRVVVSTTAKTTELQPRLTQGVTCTVKLSGDRPESTTRPGNDLQSSPLNFAPAGKPVTFSYNATRSVTNKRKDAKEPQLGVRHIAVMLSTLIVLISFIIRRFRYGGPVGMGERAGADNISLQQM